jgi:hypothetical protein
MRVFLQLTAWTGAACLFAGCASTDNSTASSSAATVGEVVSDQPQTSVAGEGSLMPGAYGSRRLQTGQFTGRERTSDQVGQNPVLPREADPRELSRSDESLGTGAGSLGQSGIVPDHHISTQTLMETTATDPGAPAHLAVTPPGSQTNNLPIEPIEGVGSAPAPESGTAASTNSPGLNPPPER